MPTYRLITNEGRKLEVKSPSAGAAIETALRDNPGVTIVECYSGLKEEDVEFIRRFNSEARPIVGWIDHEVPVHLPMPEVELMSGLPPEPDSGDFILFDDEQIKKESEQARYLRDHPPTPDGKAGGLPIKGPKHP